MSLLPSCGGYCASGRDLMFSGTGTGADLGGGGGGPYPYRGGPGAVDIGNKSSGNELVGRYFTRTATSLYIL